MFNATEIFKTWEKHPTAEGYRLVPSGTTWAKTGAGVSLGDDVSLGNDVRLGAGVSLGDDVSLGAGAVVGANSTEAIDLGFADGYRKTLCCVGGIAYIGAGCRWFTLSEAIKHWGNHNKNRKRTLCLLESAKALADLEGWKYV